MIVCWRGIGALAPSRQTPGARIALSLTIFAAIVVTAAAQPQQQPVPDPSGAGDPVIKAARRNAVDFGKSSPDYIVQRTTTRYRGERPHDSLCLGVESDPKAARTPPVPFTRFHWSKLDVVSGALTLDHGAESYTNIAVNGKAAKKTPAGGMWAAGEFSSALLGILAPENAAHFSNQRPDPIGNHPALRYDYTIDAAHSTWHMEFQRPFTPPAAPNRTIRYSPAYDGAIWIDSETGQVLRIEMSALDLPAGFSAGRIESSADYELVPIGGEKYSLLTHSETFSCQACGYACFRNETVFEDYRKFETNTSITFDGSAK